MPGTIETLLAEIEGDEDSGAAQLAAKGLALLTEACQGIAGETGGTLSNAEFLARLAEVVQRLGRSRPSMAPLGNWALVFYREIEDRLEAGAATLADRPWRGLHAELNDRQRSLTDALVETARSELDQATGILTLSYSSTVERILVEAAPEGCRVTVAESRPRYEGRRLCESLLAAGLGVSCITDAEIALFVARSDLVLLGADTICADLAVVNKTGSRLAALAAKESGKPCLVAADTYKINPNVTSGTVALEEKPGEEVWDARPEICANIYFEPVPAGLISSYLTEKGVLDGSRMASEVEHWRRLYEETAKRANDRRAEP